MLVLTRKQGQSIIINNDITVKVIEISDGSVKIGINAPKNIPVHREEVYEEIQKENIRAAGTPKELNIKDILKG